MIISCHPKELIKMRGLAEVLPEGTIINVQVYTDKVACRLIVKNKMLEMDANFTSYYRVFTEEEKTAFRDTQTKDSIIRFFATYKGGYKVPLRIVKEMETLSRKLFDYVEFDINTISNYCYTSIKLGIKKYTNLDMALAEVRHVCTEFKSAFPGTGKYISLKLKTMVYHFNKDFFLRFYDVNRQDIICKIDNKDTVEMSFNDLMTCLNYVQDNYHAY